MKSRRSHKHKGNSYPNWVYVDVPEQLRSKDLNNKLLGSMEPFPNQEVTTANSFGVESEDPSEWILEFEKARTLIGKGQILILSVMPSVSNKHTLDEDIIELARNIKLTSAAEIELNLACPNTGGHNLIYQDLEKSSELLHLLKNELPNLNIIAKIGYYFEKKELKDFLQLNQDCLAGITSTNTFSMKVFNEKGNPIFGKGREQAGISGASIRSLSIKQAKNLVAFRNELGLEGKLSIIGVGGVVKPEDIDSYLNEAKVDAVQSATGGWQNPNLAIDYKNSH